MATVTAPVNSLAIQSVAVAQNDGARLPSNASAQDTTAPVAMGRSFRGHPITAHHPGIEDQKRDAIDVEFQSMQTLPPTKTRKRASLNEKRSSSCKKRKRTSRPNATDVAQSNYSGTEIIDGAEAKLPMDETVSNQSTTTDVSTAKNGGSCCQDNLDSKSNPVFYCETKNINNNNGGGCCEGRTGAGCCSGNEAAKAATADLPSGNLHTVPEGHSPTR